MALLEVWYWSYVYDGYCWQGLLYLTSVLFCNTQRDSPITHCGKTGPLGSLACIPSRVGVCIENWNITTWDIQSIYFFSISVDSTGWDANPGSMALSYHTPFSRTGRAILRRSSFRILLSIALKKIHFVKYRSSKNFEKVSAAVRWALYLECDAH